MEGVESTSLGYVRSGLAILCVFAIVRSAWVSDDAFIAFRVVTNFVSGNGLVSNVGERAQAFTSPLWTLVMAIPYAIFREAYFTSIVVSIAVSIAAVYLLGYRIAESAGSGALAVLALTFSRAFVDYSTSGLENPLSHLLLVGFCLRLLFSGSAEAKTWQLSLLVGAIGLTRLDQLVLVGPAFAIFLWQHRSRRTFVRALPGAALLLAWLLFALFYYGFAFPNTAYAKLSSSIPRGVVIGQGLAYLLDSIARDPLTLVAVAAGVGLGIAARDARLRWLVAGVASYLAYVVLIGGDFMSGRFLTPAFVVSVAILARGSSEKVGARGHAYVLALASLLVLSLPFNTLRPTLESCAVPDHGITDERSCYYEHTGLLRNLHKTSSWKYQTHSYYKDGLAKRDGPERVVLSPLIGLAGFAAGPRVHLIDPAALTDPFLAHTRYEWMPQKRDQWRIGHLYREIPEGYVESVRDGRNHLTDTCLAEYYAALSEVVRGPLFDWARLQRIVALNAGRYDHLLSRSCAQGAGPERAAPAGPVVNR